MKNKLLSTSALKSDKPLKFSMIVLRKYKVSLLGSLSPVEFCVILNLSMCDPALKGLIAEVKS